MSTETRTQPRPTTQLEVQDAEEHEPSTQNLPPADRGMKAYTFLFAGFVIEAILWGM